MLPAVTCSKQPPEEYHNERLGLKELLTNRETVEALMRDIALVDPLAYRTYPEYFQEVMNAKGQGSADGIDNLVSTPVDAVVWAAGAVMCPSCAMEDLQAVWDAVKNLPEDLSYKGYLDTLHIMQGGGEDVIRRSAASSTELGVGLGLGAAATGSAARALILERIAPKATVGGKLVQFDGSFYFVDGLKISQSYYERLWRQGRPAPFLQAK